MNGAFIAIEGNIGAGKTTLAGLLAEDTGALLFPERFLENPFLADFYSNPERYSLETELSFLADRCRQYRNDFPKTGKGELRVVSDYYIAKSLVFAEVTLKTGRLELFREMYRLITEGLPRPDLLVFLDMSVSGCLENIRKRGRDFEKGISQDYLEKLSDGWQRYLEAQTGLKILVINIEGVNYINNSADYAKIRNAILNNRFSVGMNHIKL